MTILSQTICSNRMTEEKKEIVVKLLDYWILLGAAPPTYLETPK